MSNCVKCKETLLHNEDTMECSVCNNNYHFYCIGITETNFKKMSKNTKKKYSCTTCLNYETKNISNPLLKLDTKVEDLIQSVNFMGQQFDDFNNKLEFTLTELKHIKRVNDTIKADN